MVAPSLDTNLVRTVKLIRKINELKVKKENLEFSFDTCKISIAIFNEHLKEINFELDELEEELKVLESLSKNSH